MAALGICHVLGIRAPFSKYRTRHTPAPENEIGAGGTRLVYAIKLRWIPSSNAILIIFEIHCKLMQQVHHFPWISKWAQRSSDHV